MTPYETRLLKTLGDISNSLKSIVSELRGIECELFKIASNDEPDTIFPNKEDD